MKSLAALNNIDLDSHIRSQLIQGCKLKDNTHFTKQVYTADAEDLPGAGKGLYALAHLPRFTIIGIYTGGEDLTAETVADPSYQSDYVVPYGMNSYASGTMSAVEITSSLSGNSGWMYHSVLWREGSSESLMKAKSQIGLLVRWSRASRI